MPSIKVWLQKICFIGLMWDAYSHFDTRDTTIILVQWHGTSSNTSPVFNEDFATSLCYLLVACLTLRACDYAEICFMYILAFLVYWFSIHFNFLILKYYTLCKNIVFFEAFFDQMISIIITNKVCGSQSKIPHLKSAVNINIHIHLKL